MARVRRSRRTYRLGFKYNERTNIRNTTLDLTTGANFNPLAVAQLAHHAWRAVRELPVRPATVRWHRAAPGRSDVFRDHHACRDGRDRGDDAPRRRSASSSRKRSRIRDRLFLTGAVRTDQNSAFGTDFQSVWYPKARAQLDRSATKSFFPQMGWLNSLRLRTAYGSAGVQPGPNDALRTISANADQHQGHRHADADEQRVRQRRTSSRSARRSSRAASR